MNASEDAAKRGKRNRETERIQTEFRSASSVSAAFVNDALLQRN